MRKTAKKTTAKTYEANYRGRKVRVTVPENDHRDPVEPANAIQDLLQDCMSPESVATIAWHLRGVKTSNKTVNREVGWFADTIRNMLGDQYKSLCEEAGL